MPYAHVYHCCAFMTLFNSPLTLLCLGSGNMGSWYLPNRQAISIHSKRFGKSPRACCLELSTFGCFPQQWRHKQEANAHAECYCQDVANANGPIEWGGSMFLLVIPEENVASTHGATHIQFSRTCRSLLRSGSATLVWHHVFHPWSTLNWMRPCPCCSLFLASVLRQLQPKRYRNNRWLWFATLQDSFLFQKLVQCIIHVSHGFRNDRLVWNQRIHDVPKHSVSRQVLKFNECYDSWQQLATLQSPTRSILLVSNSGFSILMAWLPSGNLT